MPTITISNVGIQPGSVAGLYIVSYTRTSGVVIGGVTYSTQSQCQDVCHGASMAAVLAALPSTVLQQAFPATF